MVPLNCDTPIIDSKAEEPGTTEPTEEELIAYFYEGTNLRHPSSIGSKAEQSEDEESEDDDEESMDWKSEDEESEGWKSEVEESEDEKSMDGKSYGECKYCLKVDKHPTQLCSYRYQVPKNAIVGDSCVVACLVCGCLFRDSCCADCGLSIGYAILKDCTICGNQEEHLNHECPEREEKRKDCSFTYDPYTGSFSVKIRPSK
ncbi:TNF receptor-associated factor family protein DDB_G0290931-like [Prunus avium]|uniref:TNF receptor-associated factor family protein DDB_G0290931-like n=1 Tax=Prunus avium TaxID=42229 RepID=A0A6P5T2I4_PRUAV|nr:TNF receptor-associated factor family protein DDB_G0290931-like [Prunus avium]